MSDVSEARRAADERRGLFEQSAERYHRMRPRYPDAMYDGLAELCGLAPGARVVEVGSGTGLATLGLVASGYRVRCIEPGEKMAAIARRELGDAVDIVPERFEDWEAEARSVDLVFAATSWMWVDPAVGYDKAARLLRDGGYLALAWQTLVSLGPDGLDEALREVYEEIAPELAGSFDSQRSVHHGWAEQIASSGRFHPCQVRRYEYERTFAAGDFVESAFTYGKHEALEPVRAGELRGALVEVIERRFEGSVSRREATELIVAKRR